MPPDESTAKAKASSAKFDTPSIGLFTRDVGRLVRFYMGLGFRETYRNTEVGPPDHVEVKLDGLTIGISSVEAAVSTHGLNPNLGGRPVYILLWTHDADVAYSRMTAGGAVSLRPPQDFLSNLRTAWVSDPDGNPINIAQRRS
jgi:predicted enzyme related to lactoylglutathione lyase